MESNQLQLFIEEEPDEKPELAAGLLVELWHQSFIVEGYASKEDADIARTKGEQIMKLFFNWWSQKQRTVQAIETGFHWESPDGFVVRGRFDRVEKTADGIRIIDFKTGALRTQEEVDVDMQLSMYALAAQDAFGLPCTELSLLFLREDGITEVQTSRTPKQLEQAVQEMDSLVEGIDMDNFEPTPSKAVCSRCPYRGICDVAEV